MHSRSRMIQVFALVVVLGSSLSTWGQESASIGRKVLPSFVTLKIRRANGDLAVGTAFLGVKDGMLITALHVLRDADKVTAFFPDGEEFDCAGIVDRDERHNIALVRLRAFGHPMLKLNPAEQATGTNLSLPIVKDGAFGVIETSVAEVLVKGGVKFYRLTGDIPAGNNGSPLMDSAGEVVGIHVSIEQDGKSVALALPSAYILALEPSLPVQPWTPAAAPPVSAGPSAAPQNTAADAGLAVALIEIYKIWAGYTSLSDNINRMTMYGNLGHLDLYKVQAEIDSALTQAEWLKADDPLRQKLIGVVVQLLEKEKQALGYDIECANLNKNTPPGKLLPQAEQAGRLASALLNSIPGLLSAVTPDLRQLAQSSPEFLKAMPIELRHYLGATERKSKLSLGICVPVDHPFFVWTITNSSLAYKLGLRGGDTIVSSGGRTWKAEDDIEDFKLMIESASGKQLEVVVNRGGKTKPLSLTIPANVLEAYGSAAANSQCP